MKKFLKNNSLKIVFTNCRPLSVMPEDLYRASTLRQAQGDIACHGEPACSADRLVKLWIPAKDMRE
jgi:hypothetical protein